MYVYVFVCVKGRPLWIGNLRGGGKEGTEKRQARKFQDRGSGDHQRSMADSKEKAAGGVQNRRGSLPALEWGPSGIISVAAIYPAPLTPSSRGSLFCPPAEKAPPPSITYICAYVIYNHTRENTHTVHTYIKNGIKHHLPSNRVNSLNTHHPFQPDFFFLQSDGSSISHALAWSASGVCVCVRTLPLCPSSDQEKPPPLAVSPSLPSVTAAQL